MPLPDDVRPYRRTEVFTEHSVPKGLLQAHATKSGVWAQIHIVEGNLAYRITDGRRAPKQTILSAGAPAGLVEPTILHEIEALGPVRFYVEFYRREPSQSDSVQE